LRDIDIVVLCTGEEVACEREAIDADDFFTNYINNTRKIERVCIMIE
jgi:hypothetical protein